MNRVSNKVALVTGGAMGIGRACAELLAAEGASVILTDWDAENGRKSASAFNRARRVEFLNHDVSSEEDWIRVIASTRTTFGRLDIVVNNAGVGRSGDVEHKGGTHIRVNSVHPGYIWTPMVQHATEASGNPAEMKRTLEDLHPVGHLGEPMDVAYGVLYLASDESKFVTGAELVIDGGYTAQ